MFESGAYIAEQLDGLTDAQIQPNGIDLTLGSIYTQDTPGEITVSGKEIGDRTELPPDADNMYCLDPGAYIVQYAEKLVIPDNHVGFVYPRSSLIRNGAMLHTAVWDAGYEGRGEGLLIVHNTIQLEKNARIGQIVYADAIHETVYDGTYQGENID